MEIPWVPVASVFGLVGSVWQAFTALSSGVDSMSSFLGAQNRILMEEQARIYERVPAWRVLRRRKLVRQSRVEAASLLSPDEDRISRQFDREATGWSLVTVAALILTIYSVVDWVTA